VAKKLGADVKTTSTEFSRDGAAEGIELHSNWKAPLTRRWANPPAHSRPQAACVRQSYGPDGSGHDSARRAAGADRQRAENQGRASSRELFTDGLVDTLVKQKKIKIHDDNISVWCRV